MRKKIVIGLGTGRCGTLSLTDLLNSQRTAHVTHEGTPLGQTGQTWKKYAWMHLPWEPCANKFKAVAQVIESYPGKLVGDVGFYYLPYVEMLIDRFPNVRFICLKRDRPQTVRSYMAKSRLKNRWSTEPHRGPYPHRDGWDKCYPKYNLPKKRALNHYWDDYYRTAKALRKKYPGRFRIWRVDSALNMLAGQIDVLQFAGVRKQRTMVFNVGLQINRLMTRER